LGTTFSTTLFIKRELKVPFSNLRTIPFPTDVLTVASVFNDIPRVAPLPVAMAFTIEIGFS